MRYDNTPPVYQTDRHRNMPDVNKVKNVRPMSPGRDAAASRATTFGANAAPAQTVARGTSGMSKTKGRY